MFPIDKIETLITEDHRVVIGAPSFWGFIPILIFGNIDLYDKFILKQNELLEVYRLQKPPKIPESFLRAFKEG